MHFFTQNLFPPKTMISDFFGICGSLWSLQGVQFKQTFWKS